MSIMLMWGVVHGKDYYYYAGDQRIDLTLCGTTITVKPANPTSLEWFESVRMDPEVEGDVAPRPITDSSFVVSVVGGSDIEVLLTRLRAMEDVDFAHPVFIDDREEELYLTRNLCVMFNSDIPRNVIGVITGGYHLELIDTLFADFRFQVLRVTHQTTGTALDVALAIHDAGQSVFAEPGIVWPIELACTPNDPCWTNQWHFCNDGSLGGTPDADIDLDSAFEYTIPATPILVAFLDDGVTPHPDLPAGRLANGYDYCYQDWDVTPGDSVAHGMATVGILAANTDNSCGIASLTGYNVRILMQRIFDDNGEPADYPNIARAISAAVDSGAAVINNSWSNELGLTSPSIDSAIHRAHYIYGVVQVFAAGNLGQPYLGYPASDSTVIAVGATDSCDQWYPYSHFGPNLDVVAPSATAGTSNPTTFWTLDQPGSLGENDGSGGIDADLMWNFGGTSAACPQVAGIATLILLRRPDIMGDPDRIRRIIRLSAEREIYGVYDTVRVSNKLGWGRVNADRALLAVTRGDANNSASVDIDDVVYLNAYIFSGGPEPVPHLLNGDSNCSGDVDIDDVVFLVGYIFAGGPPPPDCFKY